MMPEYSWDMDPTDPMNILIYHNQHVVLRIWVGSVVEGSSRNDILEHIKECDNSPWLKRWQNEKHQEVIKILTK